MSGIDLLNYETLILN